MQNPSQYMYYIDLVIIQDAKVALYWKILHFLPKFFLTVWSIKNTARKHFKEKKKNFQFKLTLFLQGIP